MAKQPLDDRLVKCASFVLLIIFGGVVFHAPLSVFFGQFVAPLLVKSWKEILLVLTLPLMAWIIWQSGKFSAFYRQLLLRLIVLYASLHILLLFIFSTNFNQKLAGLAIDLRYLLFFALVFCLVSLRPAIRRSFIKVGAIAGGISIGFATLQTLILPHDILKHIGYSNTTIAPFLTVDKNNQFIRINGTLRGPNPLGAYVIILTTILFTYTIRIRTFIVKRRIILGFIFAALAICLWASYSRSAFLGIIVSGTIVLWRQFHKRFSGKHYATIGIVIVVSLATLFAARDTYFVQNVIVHNNPSDSETFNSDQGHAVSLQDGVQRFVMQPFGGGIGSTGSASLLGDSPLIIENQYLFVAHETGWLGLIGFVFILFVTLRQLYHRRHDWLAQAVFASGVGLLVIGLIQPVFVDDTISFVWWGLAAIALASVDQKMRQGATLAQKKVENAKKYH